MTELSASTSSNFSADCGPCVHGHCLELSSPPSPFLGRRQWQTFHRHFNHKSSLNHSPKWIILDPIQTPYLTCAIRIPISLQCGVIRLVIPLPFCFVCFFLNFAVPNWILSREWFRRRTTAKRLRDCVLLRTVVESTMSELIYTNR